MLFRSVFPTANDVAMTSRLVMVYNGDEARSLDRFTASARAQFLNSSKERGKLRAFGIEGCVLKGPNAGLPVVLRDHFSQLVTLPRLADLYA